MIKTNDKSPFAASIAVITSFFVHTFNFLNIIIQF